MKQTGGAYDAKTVQYESLFPPKKIEAGEVIVGVFVIIGIIIFVMGVKSAVGDK